jgi:hypothetical protein
LTGQSTLADKVPEGLNVRRKAVIAAIVPPALAGAFYLWIGAIWLFVGRPQSVDHLPPWLERWAFVGVPLLLLVPPGAFLVMLICVGLLPFPCSRGPASACLLSSATVSLLALIDPGGWFNWCLD